MCMLHIISEGLGIVFKQEWNARYQQSLGGGTRQEDVLGMQDFNVEIQVNGIPLCFLMQFLIPSVLVEVV